LEKIYDALRIAIDVFCDVLRSSGGSATVLAGRLVSHPSLWILIMSEASGDAWILAIPLFLVGLPALAGGAVLLKHRIAAYRFGEVVDAEVVRLDAHRAPASVRRTPTGPDEMVASTATPHFRYWTADGEERAARLDMQVVQRVRSEGYRLRYKIGDRMQLLIDPARPGIAYAGTPLSLLFFPALLCFAGVLTTLIALGIFFGA